MKFSRDSSLFNLSSINNEIIFLIFRTYQELLDHLPYFHQNLFHVIQQMKRTKRESNEEASERGCNEERKNRRERVEWGGKHSILWIEALLKFEKWNFSSLDTSELLQFLMGYSLHVNSCGSVWIHVDPHGSSWTLYGSSVGTGRNLRLLKTSTQASWRNRMKFWFYVILMAPGSAFPPPLVLCVLLEFKRNFISMNDFKRKIHFDICFQ